MAPETSPQQWLDSHPYIKIGKTILAKPSSSIIVFSLALITLFIGIYLLRNSKSQKTIKWWAIALILWATGAFFAGTSYQLFTYEIKCAGQSLCSFTSWYEVFYMIFSVCSVNSMLIAVGYSSIDESTFKKIKIYVFLNMTSYIIISLIGGFLPSPFMISFELMLLFTVPNYIICFIFNIKAYLVKKDFMNKKLFMTWIYLLFVMIAYYSYLLSGIEKQLWAQKIWFSANDVLHIGLIIWMLYILVRVAPQIKDRI